MIDKNKSPKSSLRQRAEALLEKKPLKITARSADEGMRLLHELQIHQIELEMQNDELRQTQRELEKQRDRYSNLYNDAPVGYMTIDDAGIILEANHTLAEMLNIAPADLFHRPFSNFIHADDQNLFFSRFKTFYRSPGNKTIEIRLIGRHYRTFHARLEVRPVGTETDDSRQHHKAAGLLVIVTDISRLKETEALLRHERDFNSAILQTVDALVLVLDPSGRIKSFNRTCENVSGYSLAEVVDQPIWQILIPAEEKQSVRHIFQYLLKSKASNRFTNRWRTKGGELRLIDWSNTIMLKPDGTVEYVVGTGIDITERRRAEEEKQRLTRRLVQANKMEAIATLAGGIAHEFNNALVGVTGNAELLQMTLPEDPEADRYIESIKGASERMARLTSLLLAYARGGKYQARSISLGQFVQDTLPLITYQFESRVKLHTELQPDLPRIEADTTQLQMVISGVLNNAYESIDVSGNIEIDLAIQDIDTGFAAQHAGMRPGRYVCLTIADDGKGMDPEVLDRIFEPFFTTKFQGRGLGMSAVYGIVKNHNGWIGVTSRKGEGTVVSIYLPLLEETVQPMAPEPAEPSGDIAAVLLIEDETVVIDVCRAMLENLGHRVIEARTGKQAIELVQNGCNDIDLAILDIRLPDMNGAQIYSKIKAHCPKIPVIIASGYSVDGPAREILNAGARAFIQKPYTLSTLSATITDVLQQN